MSDLSNFRGRQLHRLSEEEFAEGAAACVEADQRRKAAGTDHTDDDYQESLDILIENQALYARAAAILATRRQITIEPAFDTTAEPKPPVPEPAWHTFIQIIFRDFVDMLDLPLAASSGSNRRFPLRHTLPTSWFTGARVTLYFQASSSGHYAIFREGTPTKLHLTFYRGDEILWNAEIGGSPVDLPKEVTPVSVTSISLQLDSGDD